MPEADRQQIPQYQSAPQYIGLAVAVTGVPTDVDSNIVTVTVVNEDSQSTLFTRTAAHVGLGRYQILLSQTDTDVLGNYAASWIYAIAGQSLLYTSYYAVGGAEPAYDNLTDDLKAIADSVYAKLADMFDSPSGGPNLYTYFQSNWSRGRIAQCIDWALDRINTAAQPYSNYSTVAGGAAFPTAQWGALLRQACFVEALKHLRRSYVEQPDFQGSTISRLDRRDYFDRWGVVLADEEALLRPQLDHFKIKQMGLGRPAILVSGGVYGRYSPVAMPGMAGRPHLSFVNY
jgi:hypothetical protein